MRRFFTCLLALAGCFAGDPEVVAPDIHDEAAPDLQEAVTPPDSQPRSPEHTAPVDVAPRDAGAHERLGQGEVESLGVRVRDRTTLVYATASKQSAVHGRIPASAPFWVRELVDAQDCKGEGWARVDAGGFVCLERASASDSAPAPVLSELVDDLVPFVYARPRNRATDAPTVPRYRSRRAMNRGDAPEDSLVPWGTYAFKRRHGNGPEAPVLVTTRKRAVELADMRRLRPSDFEGVEVDGDSRELLASTAWAIGAPTAVRANPVLSERAFAALPFHARVEVRGPDRETDGSVWRYVIGTTAKSERVEGWVERAQVRRLRLVEAPADIGPDQAWLDVDLREQTMVAYRGSDPVFATLISSGRRADPTPLGVFRIETKHAFTNMQSLPDADDPYFVEAVPWAQYFQGRYALHGVYWHNRFGRPASHGCINLAPRDARRVFELTTPTLPPGWIHVHEGHASPGTVVRVRRDDANVPDRRAVPDAAG